MLNWADLISRAITMYSEKEKYCYWYGASGEVMTDEIMYNLMSWYPEYFSQYSWDEIDRFMDYSRGKIGYDCSGFIDALTGQDNYSTGYYEASLNKTTPEKGTWGNILYTTFEGKGRHIGLDIGAGRFIHMPKEGRTLEMEFIRHYPWEHSGQVAGVSYFLTSDR